MLTETKVETWLKEALSEAATLSKVTFYTASEVDEPIKRPAVFIECDKIVPTAPWLWGDGIYTASATVTVEVAVGDKLSYFLALVEAVADRLKDTSLIISLASRVDAFKVNNYQITGTVKATVSQSRFFEFSLIAKISPHG
jgi:hypothetical protein